MKKFSAFLVLFFTPALCGLFSLYAEPSFHVSLDSKKISLDQTCTLSIRFEWPKNEAQYAFAIPEPPVRKLKLQRQGESQETLIKGGIEWTQKTFHLEFKPLESGQASIGEFQIQYVDSLSQKQGQWRVPESSVEILRPRNPAVLLGIGTGLILFAIAAGFALRRRFAKKKILQSSPTPSEAGKFHAIHEKIRAGPSFQEGIRDLSKEFRSFLVHYYHLPHPPEAGEEELIGEIQHQEISLEEKKLITGFLSGLLAAKFQQNRTPMDFEHLAESIVEFVEKRKTALNS